MRLVERLPEPSDYQGSNSSITPNIYYKYIVYSAPGVISLAIITYNFLMNDPPTRSYYDPENNLPDSEVLENFKLIREPQEITQAEYQFLRYSFPLSSQEFVNQK